MNFLLVYTSIQKIKTHALGAAHITLPGKRAHHTWIQPGSLQAGDRWCENEPDTEKFNFISWKTVNTQQVSMRFILKLQKNSYGWLHLQPKHGKQIHQYECHYINSAAVRPPCYWTSWIQKEATDRSIQHDVAQLTKIVIRRRILHVIQHFLGQMFQLILRPEGRSTWCRSRDWISTLKKNQKTNSLWCGRKAFTHSKSHVYWLFSVEFDYLSYVFFF